MEMTSRLRAAIMSLTRFMAVGAYRLGGFVNTGRYGAFSLTAQIPTAQSCPQTNPCVSLSRATASIMQVSITDIIYFYLIAKTILKNGRLELGVTLRS